MRRTSAVSTPRATTTQNPAQPVKMAAASASPNVASTRGYRRSLRGA